MNRLQRFVPQAARCFSASAEAKRTCLYDVHKKHGGKLVNFAGFEMPVQYNDLSVSDSTVHTRKHVSIFDVSHMLQTHIKGKDRIAFIESLTSADVEGLKPNSGALSVFTNEKGGIKDDLIITKTDKDFLYLVTNAGCIEKDLPYMLEQAAEWRKLGRDVQIEPIEGRGLIALQGLAELDRPEMANVLQAETDIDLSKLTFMTTSIGKVFGIEGCRVTRCGYTGEDGVENGNVKLAGLGARDALRLEAGLCLYGSDIDENTTPIEANLAFVVAKRRRQTLGFPGAEIIIGQLKNKDWKKRRVGIISDGGRSPRGHIPLNVASPIGAATVGFVTSGCPSPTLGKNIGMAYVDAPYAKDGTELEVDFGKKQAKVTVAKMPFLKTNYYTGKK